VPQFVVSQSTAQHKTLKN